MRVRRLRKALQVLCPLARLSTTRLMQQKALLADVWLLILAMLQKQRCRVALTLLVAVRIRLMRLHLQVQMQSLEPQIPAH